MSEKIFPVAQKLNSHTIALTSLLNFAFIVVFQELRELWETQLNFIRNVVLAT